MYPIDDPSWPACPENTNGDGNCAESKDTGWCIHIREFLVGNLDAEDLTPGEDYCIPIFPKYGLYARVNLDVNVLNSDPVMCKLALVKSDPNDVFGIGSDEFINLGIHTAGEGRYYISQIILEWMRSLQCADCHHTDHGLKEENSCQQLLSKGPENSDYWANQWSINYLGKCLWCRANEINKRTVTQNWTASSFGLDGVNNGPGTYSSNTTLAQLQNRFGGP